MTENNKMYKLPIEAYTSKEWFQKEQSKIFNHTWQFVGFVDDLKSYGDHLCTDIGKYHIIVIRDINGEIIAFHTSCLHRGNRAEIIQGEGKKTIRCPYHNWTYDLNGQLIGVPEKKDIEFDEEKNYRLKSASVAIWKTMIFVHPDEDPDPFDISINPLEEHMGPHQVDLLDEYKTSENTYVVKCNWKIFAENYMDGYHLPYLHANTLNMYDHSKQKSKYVGDHWTFYEPLTEEYIKNLNMYNSYLPIINHIEKKDLGAYVHLIFPNVGITESESAWTIIKIVPLSENRTYLEYRSKVMPKAAKYSKKSFFKKEEDKKTITLEDYPDPLNSGDFMIEDMYVCENIQKSMESRTFKAGPMHTKKEISLSEFQKLILKYME